MKSFSDILFNKVSLPPELLSSTEFKVLHLSDTPTAIYPAIYEMLAKIKPDVLIHSGDLADDIKLELSPYRLDQYAAVTEPFLKNLAKNSKRLYISIGNHDSHAFLKTLGNHFCILENGSILEIHGKRIAVSHYFENLPKEADYGLFGHGSEEKKNKHGKFLLDGIKYINILLLPSAKVYTVSYPYGTNHHRKYKNMTPTLL